MSMLANRILPAGSIPAGALVVVFRFHSTEIRPGMLEHVDIISHSFHQACVFDHFREDANRCSTSRHLHTSKLTCAGCGMKWCCQQVADQQAHGAHKTGFVLRVNHCHVLQMSTITSVICTEFVNVASTLKEEPRCPGSER